MHAPSRFATVALPATLALSLLAACGSSNQPEQAVVSFPTPEVPAPAETLQLIVDDAAAPEGAAADNRVVRFVLRLSESASAPLAVNFATSDGSAVAGDDYVAVADTVSFAAGDTEQVIDISLIGDDTDEAAEDFTLTLGNPVGVTLARNTATGTIANDDAACQQPPPGSENPWFDRRIINFSHRGGAEDYPENTLYSYKQSVAIGAEVLEMDVYETADGELVVIHDASVDRTTGSTGSVSSFTVAELKTMDAAFRFIPGRGAVSDGDESEFAFRGIATGDQPPPAGFTANDFTIPTLEEILQIFPNHLINIELKPDEDSQGAYEQKLAELLLAYGRHDDVIVASFLDNPATLFKAQAPCVSTSFPTAQAASFVIASQGPAPMPPLSVHQAFQVPPSLGLEVVTQDFVDDAHAAGVAVHVWTINACDEMVRLLNLDVDAIMTDRPNLLQALLAQPEGQWSCDGLES